MSRERKTITLEDAVNKVIKDAKNFDESLVEKIYKTLDNNESTTQYKLVTLERVIKKLEESNKKIIKETNNKSPSSTQDPKESKENLPKKINEANNIKEALSILTGMQIALELTQYLEELSKSDLKGKPLTPEECENLNDHSKKINNVITKALDQDNTEAKLKVLAMSHRFKTHILEGPGTYKKLISSIAIRANLSDRTLKEKWQRFYSWVKGIASAKQAVNNINTSAFLVRTACPSLKKEEKEEKEEKNKVAPLKKQQ